MSERNDETITEVRKAWTQIAAEFGHDPKRLVEHYLEMQKQYQERIIAQTIQGDTSEQKAA